MNAQDLFHIALGFTAGAVLSLIIPRAKPAPATEASESAVAASRVASLSAKDLRSAQRHLARAAKRLEVAGIIDPWEASLTEQDQ